MRMVEITAAHFHPCSSLLSLLLHSHTYTCWQTGGTGFQVTDRYLLSSCFHTSFFFWVSPRCLLLIWCLNNGVPSWLFPLYTKSLSSLIWLFLPQLCRWHSTNSVFALVWNNGQVPHHLKFTLFLAGKASVIHVFSIATENSAIWFKIPGMPCCKWFRPALHPQHGHSICPQPVHYALLLPIGFLLHHHEGSPYSSIKPRLLSWLHNGGTTSSLTSGQQKLYTSSLPDLKLTCADCTLAHQKTLSLSLIVSKCGTWSSSAYFKKLTYLHDSCDDLL